MSTKYDTNPGAKSAEEVQREVRKSRAEVEDALDAIQERLSPGQMFDQALDYLRSSGGNEFLRNFGATVRDNPVPVALMGTGLAWLMLAKPRSERRYYYGDPLDEYPEGYYRPDDHSTGYYPAGDYAAEYDDDVVFGDRPLGPETAAGLEHGTTSEAGLADRAKETAEAARRKADELRASGQATAQGLAEGARETAQEWSAGARATAARAREQARRFGAGARERLGETGHHLRDGARGAQARAGYYGRRMQRGFFDTLHEQPLVLGAVGLAVGAAIGAALPATKTEDEWMGETRDQLKDRAQRLSREQLEKARSVGRAAYQAALDEADKEGLTPEGAMAAAEAVERKAEHVVEAASEAAKTEAERQNLGQTQDNPV